MKQTAKLLFRLIGALLVALLVAAAQYVLWSLPNKGLLASAAGVGVQGFAYAPYQRNQSPLTKRYPTDANVAADLAIMAQSADRIRTYGSIENQNIVTLAPRYGMQVTAGAWLSGDKEANDKDLDAAIAMAKTQRHVDRIIVGNEAILRTDLSVKEIIPYLDRARAELKRTKKQVSTAEPWHVWLKNPELANHVDFITVHLLPYHEGVPVEAALGYAMQRYDELVKTFPKKKIVIGEIGWPSRGPTLGAAEASGENQARFIREFLSLTRTRDLDYYLMEAFDQPWKIEVEGWAGAYWGMYNAEREPKFAMEGLIINDPHWERKALISAGLAFIPMLLVAFFLRGWGILGRLWSAGLIQACVATLVIGLSVPADFYLTRRDLIGLTVLVVSTGLTAAVLLSHGFEFGEILFKGRWKRRFTPLAPLPREEEPFMSIHLACCNEPPEMVIATIESLARLDYTNYEVLVVDNNTQDEALWKPIEAYMATLGPNFRFFHLRPWPGFKAGALNFALKETDPRAEVVGVVDADYVVTPDWLSTLAPHFKVPGVAVVQAPQAHRDWENQPFRRMCNWEFDGFFRIGMHHRNERNALIQHGTMTLVRRESLDEVGGWSEWCICEDTELGLRLIEKGYETRYVDHILGRGLTPADFAAIKSQRFRWAFGAMQILKGHLKHILGPSRLNLAQRYHFLTGWFAWFGDALQLVFAFASILWTIGILAAPKDFSLPVTALALPILGFMAFKAALGPILYRRTMDCPWKDILGASVLSVGISHAIARGIFAGVVKKKGEFVRTPKGWKAKGAFAFFAPIREELGLLVALLMSAAGMIHLYGADDFETQVWIGILLLETIPYWAAILCQVAAYWPEGPAQVSGSPDSAPTAG
ncbi:MAG: glycosyltransferase [Rhodocyclaceae bacterium]|jgi:exo-beta-1,3-glucanase (GH17 family)/cellulose synthase/poly-beta-1,6-N-acetylglucosamine synthase-like glycosyltransferase|nr:glycosyltransferase [Rhodocyclaceae bacterium]